MERLDRVIAARNVGLFDLRKRLGRGERVLLGAPTGHPALDKRYGGLPFGVVSALAADTGVGKTAMARFIQEASARVGKVLAFNLEDGNQNLADLVIGKETGLGATRVRVMDFTDRDEARIKTVEDLDYLKNIYVEDSAYDIDDIEAAAMEFAAKCKEHNQRFVLGTVDYAQLVSVKGATEVYGIRKVLGVMQRLAKVTGAAWLALSQVTTKKIMDRGYQYYFEAAKAGQTGDALYEGYAPRRGDFHWASEFDQYCKFSMAKFRPGPYRRAHNDLAVDKTTSLRILKASYGPVGKRYTFDWMPDIASVGVPSKED